MSDQIKQIAERLQGLRDVLELTPDEVAKSCQLSVEEYLGMESGEKDISVSALQKIARKYGIALDVLMFGEEPKMSSYFLTRCGSGVSVERTKAYKYQSLASGFRGRKADPFIVTVEPKPENTPIHFNSHEGQEFNLVIEGRMLRNITRMPWIPLWTVRPISPLASIFTPGWSHSSRCLLKQKKRTHWYSKPSATFSVLNAENIV